MQQRLKLTSVFVVVIAFVVAVQSQSQMMGEQFQELLPDTQLSDINVWFVTVGGHKNIADHQNDAKVQEVAEFAVKQVHLLLCSCQKLLLVAHNSL